MSTPLPNSDRTDAGNKARPPLDITALDISGLPAPSRNSYALITGASQGIGRAMARDLAALGYNVALVARREQVLKELAADLAVRHDVLAEVIAADLATEAGMDAVVEFIEGHEISIVINSAGIASFGPFISQSWDYEHQQLHLNATAVHRITFAAVGPMVKRGRGAICNVGSAAGNVPIPNNATYVLTKAGVNAFTEALHYELKGTGVSCTLLAPGPVREAVIADEDKTIVDRAVPDFLWTTYESCSRETLEAMSRGQRRVVPGPLSKAMNFISAIAPTAVLSPLMGKIYSRMS